MAEQKPTISAGGSSPQKTTGRTLRKAVKRKPTPTPPAPKGVPTAGPRLDAWLADPGLRSKLPDSALSSEQLAQRQANAYGAAPAAPGSSISNSAMKTLLASMTGQQFGPAEQAYKQQGQNIPVWFAAYRDQVAAAQKAQAAGAAAQTTSLNTMADAARADTGGLTGAPMDAAGAARAQAAAQIRGAGVQNQAALAQNLGAVQDAFLANQGILSQGQESGAKLALAAQVADLAKRKGEFQVTQHDKILADESDQALKNALTTAQIGSTDANTASTKATTTKTKTATAKSKADQAFFDKHGYYPSTGKPTPDTITSGAFAGYTKTQVAGMDPATKQKKIDAYNKTKGKGGSSIDFGTPAQQSTSQTNVTNAKSYAAQLKAQGRTRPEIVNALLTASDPRPIYKTVKAKNGSTKQVKVLNADGTPKTTGKWTGVSSAEASAALDALFVGHLSPATIKKLHDAGIKVNALGIPTKRDTSSAPAYKGPDQSPGDKGTN